ncbi:hypothetical protein WJX72_010765 [[Myrmecia] bisecta]|uniref:Glycerol-3-phosphate dehydrogenase [NAD(+)] n=1 Tax=[Myrmecia] bisecta TaxID=41462 RepID=A0AAW1RAG5_9CHLO
MTEDTLSAWRRAQAVCFSFDNTVTENDTLDLLAQHLGLGPEAAQVAEQAANGQLSTQDSLQRRLQLLNCSPQDILGFLDQHPPATRLAPGVEDLVAALQARGIVVYLASASSWELTAPIAQALNIPYAHVFADGMAWQETEAADGPRLVGFTRHEAASYASPQAEAVGKLRDMFPYQTLAFVGSGTTDLEAAQLAHGADIFIAYAGVVQHEAVVQGSDWSVRDFHEMARMLKKHKVACIGSGAWACAAVRIVAYNTLHNDPRDEFAKEVTMWVHEEEVNGRKLSEIINETHENVKYLPGVKLGDNVVATPDLLEAVSGADIIMVCVPHQFVHGICKQLQGHVSQDAIAVSLTKGMRVRPEGPQLISEMVRNYLRIDCSVLMGANIAQDIASEQLSEATIGYTILANAEVLKRVFETHYFYVTMVPDVAAAEMCGTLKNIVALSAGFVDGLAYGPNTKAAIMREGLQEMRQFCKALYPTVRDETFFESCGVADLIATCYGGRNRKVAEAYVKALMTDHPKTFDELEAELLHGQKLQGVLTSNEVQEVLRKRGWQDDYPLFTTTNRIVNGRLPPHAITAYRDCGIDGFDYPERADNPTSSQDGARADPLAVAAREREAQSK